MNPYNLPGGNPYGLPVYVIGDFGQRTLFHLRSRKQGMAFGIVISVAPTVKEATKLAREWAKINKPGFYVDRWYE